MRSWLLATAVLAIPMTGRADDGAVALPAGVKAVWDLASAWKETTSTRERVCLNGLWKWQPAEAVAGAVPEQAWGWFKVPGPWPGVGDYLQKDSQEVIADPAWKDRRFATLPAAWYQRTIEVPTGWAGRRVWLRLETLNSLAAVHVDGRKVGEIRFPGGDLDVTDACPPGSTHVLSLFVAALPLKAVMMSFADTAHSKEVKGTVERPGLCGDVYLASTPAGPRTAGVRVGTSVRRGEITVAAALDGLEPQATYRLRARVSADGKKLKEFRSAPFTAADLKGGELAFTESWKPDRLWDTDTPQNQDDLDVTLETSNGRALDAAYPVRFGFREFWIDGKDFYLNGVRLHLSVLPIDNAQVSAGAATYAACRETFARMQSVGVNAVYTHNYGCEPGSHLGFTEELRAADDAGMLVFFSQPHFGQYEWDAPDADARNGYAAHAAWYVGVAGTHPAVVMYAMSHNGCGYGEDMNPDMMGGAKEVVRDQWAKRNEGRALRAEAIVRGLDPTRIVYHHSGGDMGAMHTVNFYTNWVPLQEMQDWLGPWADHGKRPVFLCEYGAPLSWDFAMYRGWYRGDRVWGEAEVPWEFCMAEWESQFLGDRAYGLDELERAALRWEADQFRRGDRWHRWDYWPAAIGDERYPTQHEIYTRYLTGELRALRTWGISGYCLWDCGIAWKLRDGADTGRADLPTDWDRLQRPGFSPDYVKDRFHLWFNAYERSDWTPNATGRALTRNNGRLLAWIASSGTSFTARGHNETAGETVTKQVIVLNDLRRPTTATVSWSCALPTPVSGEATVTIPPGDQVRVPVSVPLPASLAAGAYRLSATVDFAGGDRQTDEIELNVVPAAPRPSVTGRVAVWDPEGETGKLLAGLGVSARAVQPADPLDGVDLLIVGRRALSAGGPAPDLSAVRGGLKVVVFEQTKEALEGRLGFRVAEYGFREVFPRIPDHPAIAGLDAASLHDWRGAATLNAPRLDYEMVPMHGPTIPWCGIPVTRLWRCGNTGNVASVAIEKPARGDFLPILNGGFSLQYSPLLEYREGRGMVLFCQMDVTGRTEADPAADRLVRNLLGYVSGWKPAPRRTVAYAGEPRGEGWLKADGFQVRRYEGGALGADEVLVVGPGAGKRGAPPKGSLDAGGRIVAVGLDRKDAGALDPGGVTMDHAEHIACVFEPPALGSPFAGVGPADVHNRTPRTMPLVGKGGERLGDGVLGTTAGGRVVFDQLAPWTFESTTGFTEIREDPAADPVKHPEAFVPGGKGMRRTFRRSSYALARILANQGAAGATPLLARFAQPAGPKDDRYLTGFYLDRPVEWDDPYRFFRW